MSSNFTSGLDEEQKLKGEFTTNETSFNSGSDSSSELDLETPETQKKLDKLYRKLDMRIIPALWCFYFLSSLGAAAYGNSLTMNKSVGHNLGATLGATKMEMKTANALDYAGAVVFDLPMNLLMSVVAPNVWLSRTLMSIGMVYSCYAAVGSGKGLIAIRLITGLVTAGVWPGMAYYISMWYPNKRMTRRVGYYFTAAQLSASVAGLIGGGFQKMDMVRGYTGYQWLFIIYGSVATFVGFLLVWWLPGRPRALRKSSTNKFDDFLSRYIPASPAALTPEEELLHEQDMKERFEGPLVWNMRDLLNVVKDLRFLPIVIMYFGVAGVGFGIMTFASTIISSINPNLSDIDLSLLTAPIWLFDLGAILLITPIADRFKKNRGFIFSCSCMVICIGLFVTTYATPKWTRYGGLLICGAGLGTTYPICMSWAAEIYFARHGDLGAAASAALVSGLGNTGSIFTTYALYSGWSADIPRHYEYSNMVLVGILGASILASATLCISRYMLGDFGDKKFTDICCLSWLKGKATI